MPTSAPDIPTLPQLVAITLDDATIDALGRSVARHAVELIAAAVADPWIGARAAAEHLGLNYSTVRERAAAGELPAYQDSPGGPLWFKRSELDDHRRENGSLR